MSSAITVPITMTAIVRTARKEWRSRTRADEALRKTTAGVSVKAIKLIATAKLEMTAAGSEERASVLLIITGETAMRLADAPKGRKNESNFL